MANLGETAIRLGDFDTAVTMFSESLQLLRAVGDTRGIAYCLGFLGGALIWQGTPWAARPLLDEALTMSRGLGDEPLEGTAIQNLGWLAELAGDRGEALRHFAAALELRSGCGDKAGVAESLEVLAGLLLDDEPRLAATMLGAAEALRERIGSPVVPVWRPHQDAAMVRLRAALEPADLAALWVGGRETPLDRIVRESLARVPVGAVNGMRTLPAGCAGEPGGVEPTATA